MANVEEIQEITFSIDDPEDITISLGEIDELTSDLGTTEIVVNNNHARLTNREDPDQHPMSAITGLSSALDGKQDTLVSGVNIKTVDNESILGSGNVETDPNTLSYEDIFGIIYG